MKKWIKVIIAVVIFVIFARALIVLSGMENGDVITKPSIAVMDISGQIFDSSSAIETLKKLKNNPLVEGVIVRVDSPGGAVTPSMEIYDYILNLGKPVYAAMGSVAASGGYLISLGADSIYAEPSTITGSIGVIMNLVNTQELMDKIGVKSVVLKSGAYKDAGSPARQMTEQDKKVLNDVLMDMYYQFTDIVIQRRGLAKEKVMQLADGRVYTGRMAQQNGLINHLGSWRKAADDMKDKLNKPNLEVYEVPAPKTMLEKLTETSSKTELGKIISTKTGFFYLAEIY
ncbi:MAG: signal peptide peptidase SppA [Mucispirillum sp.]|uniref:Signal peptide peptidase SppA n=1 Tax=Candidatus Mucispirillum faecigallinarum TaxID=2838699 RepID=A0A9D2GUJ5_9BACT|nr:signal peptide peptidase SppA [Mucispirillum sp.]HIZ89642.1 signal peptide peptidase SppA [Candidatus Mucispirillum faecigallinarum]